MSCGMTPEIFAKIQQMQELEDAKKKAGRHESNRALQKRIKKAEAVKAAEQQKLAKSAAAADADADVDAAWDWTRTYSSWEQFEDPEEVAVEQKKHQKRVENQQKKGHMGCDHDHSAERELMDKSVRTKLDECHGFRAEGNAWFQEGQHFRAGERFRKVSTRLYFGNAGNVWLVQVGDV
jgi:DNA phosphorothioation-dependent restriction protein DptG